MQVQRWLTRSLAARRLACAAILMALSVASSACDRPNGGSLDVQLLPSTLRPVVLIRPGLHSLCSSFAHATPIFDLIIQASTTVTLDRVSIELIDGSNLGGPAIPIPQPRVTTPLSPTVILPGTTTTLPFQVPFSCAQVVGRGVGVTAVFIDADGVTHFVGTTARL